MTQEASQAPETGHGEETPSTQNNWLEQAFPEDALAEHGGEQIPLREHPQLSKYGSAADMAKSLLHAQSLVGRKTVGLTRPAEDATPEDWEQYHAELKRMTGVPDSPDGYELDAPKGMAADERLMDWFRNSAHEMGLSPEQARGLSERYNDWLTDSVQEFARQREGRRHETLRDLNTRWGGDSAANLELARRGFSTFAQRAGINEVEQEMILSAHGDDPLMIRLFHGVGMAFAEDGFVSGSSGPGSRAREMSSKRFFAEEVFGGRGE
ncbi:hypothetical protein [Desulfovibrio ferrophilus]|uniref:Uncharacterized protein n=1 Tax=Desulfovibrio ferrophilus TaxID=241368 RepID=A0A2Z6AZS6_9BACT|nr:hypothetical protein [Desulfovibrio ferrophilus]BBD08752.1 putative uncharacterized protein [Desulfovibrio ferrophilus]